MTVGESTSALSSCNTTFAVWNVCVQNLGQCYATCSKSKSDCDGVFSRECTSMNCSSLRRTYSSLDNWFRIVDTCFCFNGTNTLASSLPPSGLESWPLYDITKPSAPATAELKYAAMDVRDFLDRSLVEGLGNSSSSWRMATSRRVDIEDLSSADVVMEGLFVEGSHINPSVGILVGKSRAGPTEHSIGICSRFLGGEVYRIFNVNIEGFV